VRIVSDRSERLALGWIVRFARNYPNVGRGLYRVTWKQLGGNPLGPTLRFRLPLV
jgi:hypothetical protein